MNILIDLLKQDPDLVHIHDSHIPSVLQTLFVCTSCDYISFSLVVCAYFKKHANAFYGLTPSSLMNSFEVSMSSIENHKKWLNFIRQTIWDRISSENESIPSYFTITG